MRDARAENYDALLNALGNQRGIGPLADGLEIDVAFCPDSSKEDINGGWDYPSDVRVKFYSPNQLNCKIVLTDAADETVFLAYGFDNGTVGSKPVVYNTASKQKIPVWCSYSTRDEGSLLVGTGRYNGVSIAKKKWHDASEVQTFDEFANIIDVSQFTWLTLYFHQIERVGSPGIFDVWLERVFIDGNTGEWGNLFNADTTPTGPGFGPATSSSMKRS